MSQNRRWRWFEEKDGDEVKEGWAKLSSVGEGDGMVHGKNAMEGWTGSGKDGEHEY